MAKPKKVLWIGDAGCPSGFGRATHEIMDLVSQHYDVTVLAVNYRGDPPVDPKTGFFYRYPMYSAGAAGPDGRYDSFGVSRLHWMIHRIQPDVIIIQNDGWFFPLYFKELRRRKPTGEYMYPEHAAIPVIGVVAIDGENFVGQWIKDLSLAIFWTQFALKEARKGGYAGPAQVIPLGVDTEIYYPVEREGALERKGAVGLRNSFVVGNVNRNQPRKRWDLLIKYFAKWVYSRNIKDASLYFHSAPTGDESFDLVQLAEYYGILKMLAWAQPETFYGDPEEALRDTYNIFDVYATTTQGEGMGLTTLEAMACRRPCIVPQWSALGDWAKGACVSVPCTTTALQNAGLAVIGGVVDERLFVDALDLLYRDKERREEVARWGFERATNPYFNWRTIGQAWLTTLDAFFAPKQQTPAGEVWQEFNPSKVVNGPAGERSLSVAEASQPDGPSEATVDRPLGAALAGCSDPQE